MASSDAGRTAAEVRERQPERELTPGLVALLAGLAAIGILCTNILLPAFPAIAASLGTPQRALGVTLSSFFLVFAFGQLIAGPLADRYGRQKPVAAGLCVFLAGSLVCGLAGDLATLVAGRVLQAAGACVASVLARAIARDLFDGDMLAKAMSMIMVAMAAAPGFSPLVGGVAATWLDWRILFVIVSAAAAALLLFHAAVLGETLPPPARRPFSLAGVARTYAGLAADGRFILPALAVSMIIGGLYGTFAAAPIILMSEVGMTPVGYGLFSAVTVFIVFGAGLLAPRLAHRYGPLRPATGGAILVAAGGVLMLAFYRTGELWTYAPPLAVFLLGMGMANPLGSAIALRPFGDRAGAAAALLGFLQMATAAAATGVAAALPLAPAPVLALLQLAGGAGALALFVTLARSGAR
ncbi:Bcr/CflA family efflux MFS transporter [Camelimonas abortus]|uniref:Bcr/CflA family efflux transporter n=1 Tax=Camelimonas abortus TaxID=1017184 RepID=A0ABV7LEF0_9HYPH